MAVAKGLLRVNNVLTDPVACANRSEAAMLRRHRAMFAVAVVSTITIALTVMIRLLGADGLVAADMILLVCFAALLPWNVIGFWNALIGLGVLSLSRDPLGYVFPGSRALRAGPIVTRIAVVMPIHGEEPARVIRHLAQVIASLDATGEGDAFEIFLLSDTQDRVLAAREAAAFDQLRGRVAAPHRLHYRRRRRNEGAKSGNLWDFLEQHGRRFDHMLVLDADSVMSGAAVVRLVRIMDANPRIGILQQLIVGLPNHGPFPRIFQFGMRHGMRAHTMGSAWWQGDCGPYWGHNALIRIAPFMAHCRLPVLPGVPPWGGDVLSHDQVEAVLMRRAGWEVRVLPDEAGSYEENPPTLPDFVKRDLRWCQGNLQYLGLLRRLELHRLGQLQLWLAVLMYVSGPAWLLFSLAGFALAVAGPGPAAAPVLGAPASWEPWALLAGTMVLVFAPKLAGVAQVVLAGELRRTYGGGPRLLASTLIELVFSFFLAPIVAVAQTVFVLGMAMGRTIRWEPQLRDSRRLSWLEAARGLWPQTALGLLVAIPVLALGPPGARIWVALFCGPLLLAVPFAVLTSRLAVGRTLARLRLCAVPEEIEPPPVVAAAGYALELSPAPRRSGGGVLGITAPASPPVD